MRCNTVWSLCVWMLQWATINEDDREVGGAVADKQLEFFARCAGGFEQVLGDELRTLHMRRVRPQVGGAIFFGTVADAYRACLWLRVATRVQLVLARVVSVDAQTLYEGVHALPWEELLVPGATIAVDAHGENDELRNTKFVALKVKDAVCDALRERSGARPDVDPHNPDFAIDVAVHPRKATIYLNLSGASLHRRGYREDGVQTEAPLKETLAAGVLLAAGWPEIASHGGVMVDPMCGSGTFAVEGAMMAAGIAPGLLRERWGFEGWLGHEPQVWERVRGEAREGAAGHTDAIVIAGDLDAHAVDIAKDNARRAGVEQLVRFHVDDAARLGRHLRGLRGRQEVPGLLVANPPYGQRLGSVDELPRVNAALASAVASLPESWKVALITPDGSVDTALGRTADQTISCHNGPIRTWVRLYEGGFAHRLEQQVISLSGRQVSVPVAEENSAQFAARLRKAGKERLRWARREGIGCFRVYDADLPDYALSVDLYLGSAEHEGQRWAIVEERRRPGKVDEQRAARRFADAVALTAATLDVPREQVIARAWRTERDRRGRRDGDAGPAPLVVSEHGLTFEVDLNGRPDTGLPIALRGVRELVSDRAKDARVANLFATTGAATVYAAAAGARSTTSIDTFEDRVEWVRSALARNGCEGMRHRLAREDARVWLQREAMAKRTYDLVVCVPPTWMPARTTGEGDWELQRDHAKLLAEAARILAPKGEIVFACELRGFSFARDALAKAGLAVEDVSARSLPHDCERSGKDHHCYLLRKM